MNRKIKTRNSSGGGKPSSKRPRSAGKRSSLKRPLLKGSSPSTAPAAASSSSSNKPPPTTSISTSSLEYRNLPATISDALFDNVCLLIACRRHEQLLLTRGTRRFLPCAPLTDSAGWEETAMEAALALLQENGENEERGGVRKGSSPFASFSLVHLLRVQLPQSERFITRLVFLATLEDNTGQNRSSCCCRNSLPRDGPVRWYPLEAAISGRLENAWGPEVAYFARLVASLGDEEENNFSVGDESIQEYSLADAFMYKMPPPTENDEGEEERASLRELLAQPNAISLSDVERAYADYLEHAFPSLFLSRTSFLFYLARHNILKEASGGGDLVKVGRRLFAAFSRRTGHQQQQYLSFTELLLGLAAIEQRTRNGRARLAMVFRYYDENRDGLLSVAEFRLMMEHLVMQQGSFASGDGSPASRSSAGSSSSSSSSSTCPSPRLSNAEVAEEMRRIGGTTGKDATIVLTLEAFLKAVLGPKKLLKGTEQLVRVSANPFAQITRSMAARALLKQSGIGGKSEAAAEVLVHRRYEGRCRGCSTGSKPPFQIAANIVRLNRRGECVDWTPVQRWPGRSSADADLLEQITFPSLPSSTSSSPSSSPLPPSSEAGKSSSASSSCRWLHNLHAKIRHHNSGGGKGTREAPLGLYHGGRGEAFLRFYAAVKRVVREVSALLEAEDRVLRVAEPVYIVGDLHGNLEDLLSIERCILRSSPHLTTNYLFLGDYVDRGRWGFEVFLYLAVAKLLNRDRVFLLRGNHEFRLTQEKYKFKEELLLKYGSTYGLKFWDLVNYVCDRLPVCAVVGGALFAAHGGIPFSLTDLGTINQQTPRVLPEPDRVAPWVWQMLWNDPMDWARFLEAAQLQKVVPSAANYTYMYLFNAKRGTAYVFNDYAAAAFLKANRLQAIIRAHEVPEELGVRFNFPGRLCTTVFSCSHYTNRMNNECSVLLVGGEGRIRVLRIDTRLNKPAMM